MIDDPLSPAQERLWFIDRLQPDGWMYNICRAFRLRGRVSHDALRHALDEIVERHAVLRTNFDDRDGRPIQRVNPAAAADLRFVALSSAAPDAVDELLVAESSRPFNLRADPLFRAVLATTAPDEAVLILTMHHIVSDGWSLSVLYRELTALYAAAATGRRAELAPLPMQYVDYARGQREWLEGPRLAELTAYWVDALQGAAPVLSLPADRPRPARQSFRGRNHAWSLPGDVVEAVSRTSRSERVTPFMIALAAFYGLLYRYTQQEDISIGVPIANRTKIECEPLIGFFANTLVLRGRVSPDLTFRQMLQQVRTTSFEAFAHQEMPFEKLVEVLRPERTLSHSPLFQVLFAFQNAPTAALQFDEVDVEPMPVPSTSAKVDLQLSLRQRGAELRGILEYSTDVFDASTVSALQRHFDTFLRGALEAPDRRLVDVPLLDEAERYLLLVEHNRTATPYPRDLPVHLRFEATVDATPEAIAVLERAHAVTYAELNRRANRLAHRLRQAGVGRHTIVGLEVDRSIETIVGYLAILKAGGAYLPLDPAFPDERLVFMVSDAAATVVLTRRAAPWPWPSDVRVVQLDSSAGTAAAAAIAADEADDNLPNLTDSGDLAYVMYTSGSTGVPKGVGIPHRAILRLVVETDYARFRPTDRVAHAANPSFDATTFEVWGALLNGAGLVIIPPEEVLTPRTLADRLERDRIDVLFLTPALFHEIARDLPQAFRPVRDLLIGGDVLDPASVRHVMRAGPPARILNAYGPTEATTFACCYEIPPLPDGDLTSIPIGRPIANTSVYVVDERLQPVPIGVTGELLIGGDGVGVGYIGRPDLTAARFVPNPFDPTASSRLYRTGDLVRYRADGTLQFIGRRDGQIKLRGFRVELGGIEAVLKQHPEVMDAVVIVEDDASRGTRLVACVRAVPSRVDARALRTFLESKLPPYEIPSSFVVLESFPHTPNGKVDREALQEAAARRGDERRHVAPRTRVEEQLVEIWKDVLGVAVIGVTDDFFEIGGHSLAATRVFSRIASVFGESLPVTTLFESPTIEALADRIGARSPAADSSIVEIQPGRGGIPIFFVHGIGGNVIGFRDLAHHMGADQRVYGIQARRLYDDHPREMTVEAIAADYVQAVKRVQPEGPYAFAGLSFGGVVAFEMARQMSQSGGQMALLALLDASALGSHKRLPRASRHRLRAGRLGRRLTHHVTVLWQGQDSGRIDYVRGRLKTLRRRARSAWWRLQMRVESEYGYRQARRAHGASELPDRLRQVTEMLTLAARRYVPALYDGAATLFRARERPAIFLQDPSLGWSDFVRTLTIREVPGSHTTMLAAPHVTTLAAELRQCLREAADTVAGRGSS